MHQKGWKRKSKNQLINQPQRDGGRESLGKCLALRRTSKCSTCSNTCRHKFLCFWSRNGNSLALFTFQQASAATNGKFFAGVSVELKHASSLTLWDENALNSPSDVTQRLRAKSALLPTSMTAFCAMFSLVQSVCRTRSATENELLSADE